MEKLIEKLLAWYRGESKPPLTEEEISSLMCFPKNINTDVDSDSGKHPISEELRNFLTKIKNQPQKKVFFSILEHLLQFEKPTNPTQIQKFESLITALLTAQQPNDPFLTLEEVIQNLSIQYLPLSPLVKIFSSRENALKVPAQFKPELACYQSLLKAAIQQGCPKHVNDLFSCIQQKDQDQPGKTRLKIPEDIRLKIHDVLTEEFLGLIDFPNVTILNLFLSFDPEIIQTSLVENVVFHTSERYKNKDEKHCPLKSAAKAQIFSPLIERCTSITKNTIGLDWDEFDAITARIQSIANKVALQETGEIEALATHILERMNKKVSKAIQSKHQEILAALMSLDSPLLSFDQILNLIQKVTAQGPTEEVKNFLISRFIEGGHSLKTTLIDKGTLTESGQMLLSSLRYHEDLIGLKIVLRSVDLNVPANYNWLTSNLLPQSQSLAKHTDNIAFTAALLLLFRNVEGPLSKTVATLIKKFTPQFITQITNPSMVADMGVAIVPLWHDGLTIWSTNSTQKSDFISTICSTNTRKKQAPIEILLNAGRQQETTASTQQSPAFKNPSYLFASLAKSTLKLRDANLRNSVLDAIKGILSCLAYELNQPEAFLGLLLMTQTEIAQHKKPSSQEPQTELMGLQQLRSDILSHLMAMQSPKKSSFQFFKKKVPQNSEKPGPINLDQIITQLSSLGKRQDEERKEFLKANKTLLKIAVQEIAAFEDKKEALIQGTEAQNAEATAASGSIPKETLSAVRRGSIHCVYNQGDPLPPKKAALPTRAASM